MKTMIGLWIVTLIPLMGCGSDGQAANNPLVDNIIEVSPADLQFAAAGEEKTIRIKAAAAWALKDDGQTWYSLSANSGYVGESVVKITALKNSEEKERSAILSFTSGTNYKQEYLLKQSKGAIENYVPEGYSLVWQDEFNEGTTLGDDWTHEVQKSGWVNNELQNYVNGEVYGKRVTELADGKLNINCFKGSDGKIYSGRVYAKVNTGWKYGYFEARILLPKGKGTWPAFWMMPVGNDWNTNPWPMCGEIDIMEEVGVVPNEVSSSIHTQDYNHTKGTQKTHAMTIDRAEGEYHVYALEWTEDAITTYVDGKVQLAVTKQQLGSGHNQWPFHYAFYPILNLAWGGDWGGMNGVDESALPVTMKVDYVRVFQKKMKLFN